MSEVIYYTSDEAGAPALASTTAGSLIGVLDACLVNGFNSKTVTSIVVASGIATVTCSAHGYKAGRKVLQAGATVLTGLNGVKLILSVPTSNTYTFDATAIANGTELTGLTAKRAPLGWTKQYGGTNLAMYARTDVTATAMMLRVDDTSTLATSVRVLSVESATDVNTYVNPAPTTVQLSGGQFWHKGNGTPDWILIGDGKTFYFFTPWYNGSGQAGATNGCPTMGFGDFTSFRAGDAYACLLGGMTSATTSANLLSCAPGVGISFTSAFLLQRAFTGLGSPVAAGVLGSATSTIVVPGTSRPIFPSPVDNGMVINDRVLIVESNASFSNPFRGYFRGLKEPLALLPDYMHGAVINNVYGSSKSYLGVRVETNAGSLTVGGVLFDITGPWD